MKQFVILITLALISCGVESAVTEARKVIYCDAKTAIFRAVAEDYEERLVWQGHSPQQATDLVLTANTVTGSWTLIEYGDTWACVLAVGERHRLVTDNII